MANYQGGQAFITSFTADADLTGAKQWTLVIPSSTAGNCQTAISGCSIMPVGILTNDPSAGQAAEVVVLGFTKAKARVGSSCWLSNGTLLKGASDAILEPVGNTDQPVLARWLGARNTTAAASILGNVLFLGGTAASGTGGQQGGGG